MRWYLTCVSKKVKFKNITITEFSSLESDCKYEKKDVQAFTRNSGDRKNGKRQKSYETLFIGFVLHSVIE